ncbi:xanthine dehydrogenase accessory protein XdhC [Caldimonas sp. KR1-144]|uniref:xanthine dehydrogenase accessory protein XdhC n=1 Tax=Caldimonas sp. KR1-144 TaxID=3400911 RepID=UPI003C001D28
MNAGVRATALRWLAQGRAAQWVEVVSTRGSAPREAGTRMLVAADAVAGTIGGGHLELQAIGLARSRLSRGEAAPQAQPLALGPSLGQCCGGAVTLRYRALDEASLADWPEPAPRFVLQLFGAGHVGRAVVRLLEGIDCRVQWIDEREDEFPPHDELAAPHIERVCVDAVEAEVAVAPAGACFLVMTHQHDLDLRITEAVLERGDFRWLGLIGSQTKRARFVHHFERRGIPAAAIERLVCPIGVPGIDGKAPEVIAVAVVAQLLQACPQTAP